MKIATWNINGLKARLEFMGLWLEQRQPDVVGLQELKLTDDSFPHDFFEALGYRAITHGQKSWNGVAVLSRLPLETRQVGLPGQETAGARLLSVRVDDRLDFTTVYCPNGKSIDHDDYALKLAWFDALAEYWQTRVADDAAVTAASENSVICGDFNIVPTPLDSWRGSAGDGDMFHTSAERERISRLMALGLVDLYRARAPDERVFSWWDYRGGAFHRKQGLRIDLLLGTASVAAGTQSVEIDREFRKKQDGLTASDHAPVIADIEC